MNDHQEILPLARYDLACYAVAIWRGFELAAYHQLIVDRLENVERGEITRLMISLPPRHGKSLLASQIFPGWYLGRHPDREIISATYGQDLSDHFGRRVRNMVSDPLHQAIFPQFRLVNDAASMRQFSTTAGGSYYAVGRGGAITGRGADLLLIDDPLKDYEEARSEGTRRALHEWYAGVAYTRLQPGAAIVLISTRWHEDDLAGRLLRQSRGAKAGRCSTCLPSPRRMKVFVALGKRFGQGDFRSRFWSRRGGCWVALSGLRCTSSGRPPRKGEFSRDNGGLLTVSRHILTASFSPGIRPTKAALRTTSLSVRLGA